MKTRNQKICENRAMEGMTFEKVGKKFGITRERVRQIVEMNKEKCSKEIKAKIISKQKHQYHEPHNILSPEKEKLRKEWIKKYHREGYSIKAIHQIFFTLTEKKIKEVIGGFD